MLLFAGLAEGAGRREYLFHGDEDGLSVEELRARLREELPAIAAHTFRVAVNRVYAAADQAVRDGDEVALLPPVAGGAR